MAAWGSSSIADIVKLRLFGVGALTSLDNRRESRVPKLACVEAIPTMIHELIESVDEIVIGTRDNHWRECPLFKIAIYAFKEQDSGVVVLAEVCIPCLVELAPNKGTNCCWIVWQDLE